MVDKISFRQTLNNYGSKLCIKCVKSLLKMINLLGIFQKNNTEPIFKKKSQNDLF